MARGLHGAEEINSFLNPKLASLSDPFLLPGMDEAASRLFEALEKGEQIAVYGDYDVDGIASTALVLEFLEACGARVGSYLPSRMEEGYGLSVDAVQRCIEAHNPSLIITVDCGTNSTEAIQYAAEQGVDVVITDHHEIDGAPAPALAVVNPKLADDERCRMLAGVGVAFKLCHAMVKRAKETGAYPAIASIDLREYLDIVALGTVADIVPLLGENRILVRHGLSKIQGTTKPGLKALLDVAGVKGEVMAYHIGFALGPRLNAAGRLGDANIGLRLLRTKDHEEARALAAQLDQANRERKKIEDVILSDAVTQVDSWFQNEHDFGVVAGAESWHQGVVGIVASRLCAKYRRPSVVIAFGADGAGRGSCRSIENVDILDALHNCSELLETFGGHRMAAGLSIKKEKFESFRTRFNEVLTAKLQGMDFRPVQRIDAWLALDEADERMLSFVDMMKPFGCANPAPVWGATAVNVVGEPRTVGKNHLKLMLAGARAKIDGIAFDMGDREVPSDGMDVAFKLQMNSFNNRKSLQLNVQDFRPAAE